MRVHFFLPILASVMLGLGSEEALATEVTVVSSRGSVSITQGGRLVHISASTLLTLPAQIKTGADGMLDLKDNDSLVHIGPNSTVALPDTGPSGSLVDRYLQSAGSALYNIQSRHGRPMSVETPYLVSVVKGTVFTVAVEEGASSVTLMEGSLDVSAPGVGQHVLLKPNQSIRHRSGESSLVVRAIGTAPLTMKNGGAETQTPATDEANAAQIALVNRDLAEVGATVSAQHALSTASGPHSSAAGSVAGPASGSTNTPPPNAPASTGAGSSPSTTSTGTSTGTPPASGSPTPPSTSGAGSTSSSGSSGTSGSNQTSTSGSPGSSDSTGSSGANSSGSSGSSGSGSSGSNGSDSPPPVVGCNGKTNGTGQGQCRGHGKPKS